jgi:diphthamide synthase subunit DPH2
MLAIKVCFKTNNGDVFTIIVSILNRGLNPNTLQVFKKMLNSPYKVRGLIVMGNLHPFGLEQYFY